MSDTTERARRFLDRDKPMGIMSLSVLAEELARGVLALAAELAAAEKRNAELIESVRDYMGPRPQDYFLKNTPKAKRVWAALAAVSEGKP